MVKKKTQRKKGKANANASNNSKREEDTTVVSKKEEILAVQKSPPINKKKANTKNNNKQTPKVVALKQHQKEQNNKGNKNKNKNKNKKNKKKEDKMEEEKQEEEEEELAPGVTIDQLLFPTVKVDPEDVENPKKRKIKVLLFASRGVTSRERFLVEDIRSLLPHSKKESKFHSKAQLSEINEIAELAFCNRVLYFESRKRNDLYLHMTATPNGPSIKFLVKNIHTMGELRMTGNCLLGSRPLLCFDAGFETKAHLRLIKELLNQIFHTPNKHPKSKPFYDHIITFSLVDGHIWFRHYQINWADKRRDAQFSGMELSEIGPRFVLEPIRVFSGSFGGETLYQNSDYISPNQVRAALKQRSQEKYRDTKESKHKRLQRKKQAILPQDEISSVFK